jgi:thiol:disulfide interchange protein DsbD
MHWFRGLALLVLGVSCATAQFEVPGATTTFGRRRAVRARLVLSQEMAKPGDVVMAGIELTHNPGWHTYWKNPGDSGEATKIFWGLTNGISADEIQWPVPEKFVDPTVGLTTYIYHDRAVLLVPLKIAANAPRGTNEIVALVKWLECKESCVPGSNTVRATLAVGAESKAGADAAFFTEAQRHLPSKQLPGTAMAAWDSPSPSVRPLVVTWSTETTHPDFFPYTNALATISNKTDVLSSTPTNVVLRKFARLEGGQWPTEVSGLLVREENGALAGYDATLSVRNPAGESSPPSAMVGNTSKGLGLNLLYAFIGGLILNIMPCVLPVIALKILGFVSQSREHPGRVRKLGILYTLGVIASFLVLAGIVIGVQAAGKKAGWGMQFSNPQFIVVLTVIVTLVALNLFGVFEVTLSGGAMSAAGQAASRHGSAGAFMNGVLATALATPCTAPFLGVSLGFAFSQPAPTIVLFFMTIALGLALPYLLLSFQPQWLKFLPKPGAWMERFKVAMGFPTLATAVWLFSLTTTFYGERSWWLGVFLVFVGAAVWTFGTFVQHGRKNRGFAVAVVAGLLASGYAWALDSKLRWRSPESGSTTSSEVSHAPEGYQWGRWTSQAVADARTAGRPVVVDFTAKWCLTCNAQVKPAFESKAVVEKLKELNAVALVADYTLYPPEITAELERFGRSGVPLVLVYPPGTNRSPIVLSEPAPLLPYGPTIVAALNQVKQ